MSVLTACMFYINRVIKISAWVFSVGLLVVGLTGCSEKDEDQALVTKHLKQAEFYLKQGQYKAANIEVRNVMQKDPRSVEGVVLGARIMAALGYHNQVIDTLSPMVANLNGEGVFTLADSYLGRTKYRSAQTLLEEQQSKLVAFDETRYYVTLGDSLAGLDKFEEALASYRKVKTDPFSADAALGEVRVLTVLDRESERDAKLAELKEKAPTNPDAMILEARIQASKEDWEAAEKTLTAALSFLPSSDEMTPRRAGVISLLSDILSRQKRSSEALRYSRILSEAFPGMDEVRGKYQEALMLFKESQFEKAEVILVDLLADAPGFESAGQLLGIINFLQGDFSEADQNFAATLDPELATDEVKQVYAMNSMRLRRPEEVVATLKPGLEESKNPNIWAMYAVAVYSAGQPEEAIGALERSIELDPKNARAHLVLARYLSDKAQPDMVRGLNLLKKAYELTPSDPVVHQSLLQMYVRTGDKAGADKFVTTLAANKDLPAASSTLLGDYALSLGDSEKAVGYYQQALKKESELEPASAKLAATYVRIGEDKKAKALYDAWMEKNPASVWPYMGALMFAQRDGTLETLQASLEKKSQQSDGELSAPLVALGSFYLNQSKFDQAIHYAVKANEFANEHPDLDRLMAAAYYAEGTLAMRKREYEQARVSILNALQAMPESTPLLVALAEIEVNTKNIAEARKIIEQVKTIDKATGLHLDGDLRLAEADIQGAQQNYEAAWALSPSDTLAARLYGIYLKNKDGPKADSFLERWLVLFPNSPAARGMTGNAYLAKQDYQGAAQEFRKGLAASPNSVVLLNNLAWVLHELKDPDAEAIAEKAASLAPNVAAVLDTYGWILHEKGKTPKAIEVLNRASQLAPENQEISEHLAAARNAAAN